MSLLVEMHCQPLAGVPPLTAAEVAGRLAEIPGWALVDDALEQRFDFADFHQTMAFVNAVAWIAHREDHHPDVQFGYDQCRIVWWTHAIGGLSENDFICAAKVDALFDGDEASSSAHASEAPRST
jgi:4a-hydroxytetrahydrobiopterin dehydratase